MITVAQRSSVPLVPAPRGRFAALTVGVDSRHLATVTPRLRSLGATAVHAATSARNGQIPRPNGQQDVCLIDVGLPQLRDELRALRSMGWRRVIVVAGRSDAVRPAILGGARGAIVPPLRPVPMGVAPSRPSRPVLSPVGDPADTLSDREVQVLQGVSEGRTNKQIGQDLCLSALTVKSHLARIARKLGTGDRAEMVAIGLRQGIIA